MKNLIKKLQDKKKKDPAHFTKKQLKDRDKELIEKAKKDIDEQEKQNQKTIKYLEKELPKYFKEKKELLKLLDAINDRFKVSATNTRAAEYGIAALYFNALEITKIPEDYYPKPHQDTPDFFITPEDEHYWLWNFQVNTSDDYGGHTIPSRPGTTKTYVIHGFLFPMTSTTIYLGKFDYDKPYGIIYNPTDELFGREWMSTYKETYFDNYQEAYKIFLEMIDNHLDEDEERYYNLKKNQK